MISHKVEPWHTQQYFVKKHWIITLNATTVAKLPKPLVLPVKHFNKWLALQNTTGSLENQYKGGNHTKVDKNELLTYIQKHPDAFQYEVAQHLGCSASAVRYQYKILGITRKKRPQRIKNKILKK